jgi:myosin protein heavy chain
VLLLENAVAIICFQMEQMATDLAAERSVSSKLENQRLVLERQNKEMRDKLAELEGQSRARTKATIAALEGKIANLEEQLDQEAKSVCSVILVVSAVIYTVFTHAYQ